jgi:hypothetical protein
MRISMPQVLDFVPPVMEFDAPHRLPHLLDRAAEKARKSYTQRGFPRYCPGLKLMVNRV